MTKTTRFVWDSVSDSVISELDETNAITATYTNEPQHYGGVISQRRGATTSTLHADALGSTRALTDITETTTDTYLCDAWGNQVANSGTTVNPFRWVGRYGYYQDAGKGLIYVRARMYRPTVAKWASVDPLKFVDDVNPYRYSGNATIDQIDPSGLICKGDCCCCAEKIDGPNALSTENEKLLPPTERFGHFYTFNLHVSLRESGTALPCKIEYWEWASPHFLGQKPFNCWRDNASGVVENANKRGEAWCHKGESTLGDWCTFMLQDNFKGQACPTDHTIPLFDAPSIGFTKANDKRRLYQRMVIKGATGCECQQLEVVWEGCQFLELDTNRKIVRQEFYKTKAECDGFPEFNDSEKCSVKENTRPKG